MTGKVGREASFGVEVGLGGEFDHDAIEVGVERERRRIGTGGDESIAADVDALERDATPERSRIGRPCSFDTVDEKDAGAGAAAAGVSEAICEFVVTGGDR